MAEKTTQQLRDDLVFRLGIFLRVLEKGAPEVILANEHRLAFDLSRKLLDRLECERLKSTN